MFGGRQRRLGDGVGIGLGEGPIARKTTMIDGPVSIPRGHRIQLLRNSSNKSDTHASMTAPTEDKQKSPIKTTSASPDLQTSGVQLPPVTEAANHPTWSGQALEYAAGKSLRQQVLEPLLREEINNDIPEEEASRLLCYFAKGHIMLLEKNCGNDDISGKVTISSMERVVQADGPTLLETWWREGDLVLSHTTPEWSDWWIQQCTLFDVGCEMIKLREKTTGVVLGVAYFERNTNGNVSNSHSNGVCNNPDGVNEKKLTSSSSLKNNYGPKTIQTNGNCEDRNDDKSSDQGKHLSICNRITLIRDIRINPKYNASVLKRVEPSTTEVEYPGIVSALFHAILLQSIRYGTNGVGVSSSKSDMMESFYETHMGRSSHRNPNDGKRWFQINAQQRFQLIKKAFRQQLQLLQQVFSNSELQVGDSNMERIPVDESAKGHAIMENNPTNTAKRKEKAQQEETSSTTILITGSQQEKVTAAATAGQATQEARECLVTSEHQQYNDGESGDDNAGALEPTKGTTSDADNTKRQREEQNDVDSHNTVTNKKHKLDVE